jgi:hypothetical protein
MKKLFITLVLACATLPALAQHHGYHHGGHRGGYYGGGWGWVAPAIIGGAVVYAATRPETVIVQQPPVVVQPQIPQGSPIIQCPQGTYPFENFGWVKNQYGQFIQTRYIECK